MMVRMAMMEYRKGRLTSAWVCLSTAGCQAEDQEWGRKIVPLHCFYNLVVKGNIKVGHSRRELQVR